MIHTIPVPRIDTPWDEDKATGGQFEPDRWYATKRTPTGVVVHELECHNAGITKGQKARAEFPCTVTVQAPPGWTLVSDCRRPLPGVWPPMHAAMRRYAMYPSGKPELAREADAEAKMPYEPTKWARGQAAYGPCNLPLQKMTAQQAQKEATKVLNWYNVLKTHLGTGTVGPVEDSEDGLQVRWKGWAPWGRHPDGHSTPDRGAPGGSGIYFYTGWEQAPSSPAFAWLKSCCNHERWWHAYDRSTGEVVTAEWYGDPGPMYQAGSNATNNQFLPEFLGVASMSDPLPLPYDTGHAIRGFRELIFLSEAVDSPAVKRMLRSVAAQLRLQCSDIGPHPTSNYTPPSLRHDLGVAKNAPHTGHFGMDTGRHHGWRAFVIAQSVKKAGATENVNWCKMYAEFSETASMPTGILSRCAHPDPNNVWYDPNNDTAHSFEVPIEKHGAIGCSIQGARPIANPTRFAEALYVEAPLMPYYNGHGPPDYAYVAKRGGAPYATIPGGKPSQGGDSSHSHAGCTLAASLDPANRKKWIDAAVRIEPISDFRKDAGLVAQTQL